MCDVARVVGGALEISMEHGGGGSVDLRWEWGGGALQRSELVAVRVTRR